MDDSTKCGILTVNGMIISPIIAALMIQFNKYPEWGIFLVLLCCMIMIGSVMVYA